MKHTHKSMTDAEIMEMQSRIERRREICRRALGANYVCHKSQHVPRKDAPQLVDVGRSNLVILRSHCHGHIEQLTARG